MATRSKVSEEQVAEYRAMHRFARITARKARLVADAIRGRDVNAALDFLEFAPQRAAAFYRKVVRSAVANAAQSEQVNVNRLVISDCRADDGPLLNNRLRWRPGPQGRAMPIRRRTSHLTVVVREADGAVRGQRAPGKSSKGRSSKAPESSTQRGSARA
jgi:large subunit ribosomal protein L22